jgi:hypothetical protein
VQYEVDPANSGVDAGPTIAAVVAAFEGDYEGAYSWDYYDPLTEPFFEKVVESDNTVSWGTIDGTGGAVAMASVSFFPWSKEIQSFKIVFDEDEPWGIGASNAFDIQNVAAHEVGHVVGLDHVNAPKDGLLTMYRYTTEGETIKRDLGLGDQLGVVDLYD